MVLIRKPENVPPMPETHDDLANDLAVLEYTSKNLPSWQNIKLRNCRPDVITITPTYNLNQMRVTVFEVKVSRADFLQDVKKEKWRSYTAFSNYVYFACPDGMIDIEEIPDGCGLYYRKSHGWQRQLANHGLRTLEKNFGGQLSMSDWIKLAIGEWNKK